MRSSAPAAWSRATCRPARPCSAIRHDSDAEAHGIRRTQTARTTFLRPHDPLEVHSMSAKPRGRDLGLPFPGTPGPHNAITDVPGVAVGFTTLIDGDGPLVPGKGPVRTGITAIVPRADTDALL